MSRSFEYLGDVEVFLAVMEHGSFTAAAVALSTTASVLSRAVGRLEARLGQQLMRRTTRRIGLTDAGRRYLDQARSAFDLLKEAEQEAQSQSAALSGRVRISAPTTFGHFRLPELLKPFLARHPDVRLELNITNRNVDLVAEGFDMAIRLGNLPDSGLVARKLEDAGLRLVAAPDYLNRAGVPKKLDDLAKHVCLPFVLPSTGKLGTWSFRIGDQDVEWQPASVLEVSDDVLGTVSMAEQGIGICQTYDFIVRERLASGKLVELLPGLNGRTRPFSLVYAPHRHQSAAARALIKVLA
ncbi:LysR family transcriptional regulator [Noviherbaspirillum denitrificans]|uniref:LuxR family transcriptional regulator n=1 Tax=Noviherbaspirillum denitrificans TaxID=1968433 RepID=A0A254TG52_9BURK|nr:LysR family transcriptional regulator [Noviherbaspirillum denitrificans]OWW20292.1 LuxR family transcriptional regulator [Noviherbaspirillum denitrificans]